MFKIDEIAPDVFRICIYVKEFDLQFNHFLVKDDEPLLYHTGMRGMFPLMHEAVGKLIDVAALRWISWSHFEVDECGALNEWLKVAPKAIAACSQIGAIVNVADFADRPPRALTADAPLQTGKHRFTFHATPHLPHGWDAGALFEETNGTLFCSDLFHHNGECEPLMETEDLLERTQKAQVDMQQTPLMDYMPYTPQTQPMLDRLAALKPKTLAIMHGSSYRGDAGKLLTGLGPVFKRVFAQA